MSKKNNNNEQKENAKIINVTKCDEKYYQNMNYGIMLYGPFNFLFIGLIMATLLKAGSMVTADQQNSRAWILYLLGLVIFPIVFFLIPFFFRKAKYKKEAAESRTINVGFDSEEITVQSGGGRALKEKYSYSDINNMRLTQSTLSIFFNDSTKNLYLDPAGFKNGELDKAVKLLEEKSEKKVKTR